MIRRTKRSSVRPLFYHLRYRTGEYALRSLMALAPRIPSWWLKLFTTATARLTFMLLWKYRRRMQENLEKGLGANMPDAAERRALLWRAWKNFALSMLDTMMVVPMSKRQIAATMAVEGEEHLKRALEKGKGVIALSAHLGAFAMIGPRLAASGYRFSVVVKHPGDERLAHLITDYRTQIGIGTISAKPRLEATRGILKALRTNGIVLIIADEFKSGGVEMTFMGRKAAAPRGPATLALRTRAVTLPMFAPRAADGSLMLRIGPEIEVVRDEDIEASVAKTTKLFSRHLEDAIRLYPDQWNWLGLPRPGRVSRSEYLRRHREAKKAAAAKTAPGARAS